MRGEPTRQNGPRPKARVGLIGCGTISGAYFRAARLFPNLETTACADLNPTAAAKAAQTWELDALDVEALLARDDPKIILNLTVPQAHAAVTLQALSNVRGIG